MIDVHAHLCFPDFDRDRDDIASRCGREMKAVIVSSARYDEGLCALEVCRRFGNLFPTLGYHPTEGGESHRKVMELIRKNSDRIVGVGEVGLDYHWEKDEAKRELQKKIFSEFIELAKKLKKPIVIHSWDAEEDCFAMVADSGLKALFHCFSGSKELAMKIVEVEDFYISFSTQIFFSKHHKKLAKVVPLERMTLETDAPFLSPHKPERNYPWNVAISAKKIAEIKGVGVEEVLKTTDENAIRVFGLDSIRK